jgi:tetratricopeptide (TPR) repeat protein
MRRRSERVRVSLRCVALALALLLAAGCSRPATEWDRVEASIAHARARDNHPRAVELSRRLVVLAREFPPVDSARLVRSYDLLQQSLAAAGNFPDALSYQRHLIGVMDGMQRPDTVLLRRLLENAGDCALRILQFEEAISHQTRAAVLYGVRTHPDTAGWIRAQASLARMWAERGRPGMAAALQIPIIELSESSPDSVSLAHAKLLVALADYIEQGGVSPHWDADGGSLYERALSTATRSLGADHPLTAPVHLALGRYLHKHGRHAEAIPHLERGIRLAAASPQYDAGAHAESLHELAGSEARQGEWDNARAAAERAIATHEAANPSSGPLPRAWVNDLAIIYTQLGQRAAAESLLVRYRETRPDPAR